MPILNKIINKIFWGPYQVMYDNECVFCCRVMRLMNRLDVLNRICWVDKDWDGEFPKEGRLKIEETIVVFSQGKNKIYFKTDGVFRILMCLPFGFLLAWILKIPLLSIFFDYLYDKVASNRRCIN